MNRYQWSVYFAFREGFLDYPDVRIRTRHHVRGPATSFVRVTISCFFKGEEIWFQWDVIDGARLENPVAEARMAYVQQRAAIGLKNSLIADHTKRIAVGNPDPRDAFDFEQSIAVWKRQIEEARNAVKFVLITASAPDDKIVLMGSRAYMTKDVYKKTAKVLSDAGLDINDYLTVSTWDACTHCGSQSTKVVNFDRMWGEGDLCCADCGEKIRDWDTG